MSNDYPHYYELHVEIRLTDDEHEELQELIATMDAHYGEEDEKGIAAEQQYDEFLIDMLEGVKGMTMNVDLKDRR